MKYIATWNGYSSGSFMGRDDGYPERKFKAINDLGDLRNVIGIKGVEFYALEESSSNVLLHTLPADPLGILKP